MECRSSSTAQDALLKVPSDEIGLHLDATSGAAAPDLSLQKEEVLDWRGRLATQSHGGPKAGFYILANQGLWSMVVGAMSVNLVLYLVQMLQMSNATAANNVSIWSGTKYILCLIGGLIGDSHFGRLWTCAVSQVVTILGMLLLSLCATVPGLKPAECPSTITTNVAVMQPLPFSSCAKPSTLQTSIVMLAIYIIAVGNGSSVPAFQAFGGDQFESDQSRTIFFGYLFLFTNMGIMIASTIFVWLQNRGLWSLSYWVATTLGALALILFGLGMPTYRKFRPANNPVTRVAQVIVASIRKWKLEVPGDKALLYELDEGELTRLGCRKMPHTNLFRFLDKASVKEKKVPYTSDLFDNQEILKSVSGWNLCYVTQVEEVKQLCRISAMLLPGIFFGIIFLQTTTLFVEQAAAMETKLGSRFHIPPASMSVLNLLTIFVLTPLYPILLVPITRLITGRKEGFSPFERMIAGQVIAAFSITAASLVETKRLALATGYSSHLNILWQAPQQVLMGASMVLVTVSIMDFLYQEAPLTMRGIMSSLMYVAAAIGSYLSGALVSIVVSVTAKDGDAGWIPSNLNQGHLDYYFWMLLLLAVLGISGSLCSIAWYHRSGGSSYRSIRE